MCVFVFRFFQRLSVVARPLEGELRSQLYSLPLKGASWNPVRAILNRYEHQRSRQRSLYLIRRDGTSHLVAEHLDLRVRSVQRLVAAVVVAVSVDLDHERKTFHPLLGGEVRTQTVDRDEDLTRTRTRNNYFSHSSGQ